MLPERAGRRGGAGFIGRGGTSRKGWGVAERAALLRDPLQLHSASGGGRGCEPLVWPPDTMLGLLGSAALVLVAGASWVLPAAAGEPRGLGEGWAAGRESPGRLALAASWAWVARVPAR